MENFVLEIKQKFASPIKKVFDAWAKPKQIIEWYGPEGFSNNVHEFDFKVGGKYRITMTGPKGEQHTVAGEFKTIEEPNNLSFTWKWEGSPAEDTLVTLEFAEIGDGTEMYFKQVGFSDAADRDNHNKGWVSSFKKLEKCLTEGYQLPYGD
jgi:uncharacterized protein YndB with AHSA1/START domain